MKLIFFELKKFLFNWKTLILIVAFSALFLSGLLRMELSQNEEKAFVKNNIASMKMRLQSRTESSGEKSMSKEAKQNLSDRMKMDEKKLKSLEANDINQYFEWRYQEIKQGLAGEDLNRRDSPTGELKEELDYLELVKKRGLDFEVFPGAPSHAFGNLAQRLEGFFDGLWLLAFAMVLMANFANLFENKEIRLYHAFGVEKAKLIGSKLLSALGVTYLWLLLLSASALLLVGFLKGFGSPNYPAYLEVYPTSAEISNGFGNSRLANMAISNGEVILISLSYGLFVLFFLAALGMFLSVLTRRSLLVVAIMAILIEGYKYIQDDFWIQPFRQFIPMSYLNPVNLLKYPSYLFEKNSIYVGLVYLLVLGIIFLLASYFILKKYRLRRI